MRLGPVLRWLVLAGTVAASWLPIVALYRAVAASAPGTIAAAEIAAAVGPTPPAGATWRPVALPDDWRTTRPDAGEAWYRVRFVVADPAHGPPLGVYLPTVAMNAAAWVNGRLIGSGGAFAPSVARNWNRPLLFPLPATALSAGENVLALRVAADLPGTGFVPALAVAPLDLLAPVYERADFVRRTLLWALVAFRLVAAAFTAAVFLLWRREAYYGWFALCAGAWVLAEANLLVIHPPLPLPLWYWCFNVAIGWWGIFAVRLVLSFIGVAKPRTERALMRAGLVGSAALGVLAVTGSRWFNPVAIEVWLTLAFGASLYLFRGVLPRLRAYPDAIELNVVFVVAASVLGGVLFDLVLQLGLRPRGGLTVPPYTSVVAVVGMGWVLVRRFVAALTQARALAATLEDRVREQTRAIDASWRRILATERARVLAEERERILRDTEDGLGSQLVSTLALLEHPGTATDELRATVRAALDDLRLVVDSLDPLDGDLVPPLGMLRSRLQPRLAAAGIAVEWRVEDVPAIADLTPHRVLQILRVVQDVFAAAPRRGPGTLRVAVTDATTPDGGAAARIEVVAEPGLAALSAAEVARLEARARDAGGTLAVGPALRGTAVRLVISAVAAVVPASHVDGIAAATALG